MWLIMFRPNGTNQFVPQMLCYSEEEASEWVKNAPFSVVGTYSYVYVPVSKVGNYWTRREPYQLPGYTWPVTVPYYTTPEWRPWQYEIGDWPDSTPKITC